MPYTAEEAAVIAMAAKLPEGMQFIDGGKDGCVVAELITPDTGEGIGIFVAMLGTNRDDKDWTREVILPEEKEEIAEHIRGEIEAFERFLRLSVEDREQIIKDQE